MVFSHSNMMVTYGAGSAKLLTEGPALPQPWSCIHFSEWASEHRHDVTPQPGSDGVEPGAVDPAEHRRRHAQPVGDLVALIANRSEPRDILHHTHHQRPCGEPSARKPNARGPQAAQRDDSRRLALRRRRQAAWARPAGGRARAPVTDNSRGLRKCAQNL
jgi:hypothetical protein